MKIYIKYIIRFLKDEGIYYRTFEIISNCLKISKRQPRSIDLIEFMEDNFIIGGSCLLFFKWLYKQEFEYCKEKNKLIRLSNPLKYVRDFNNFLEKFGDKILKK